MSRRMTWIIGVLACAYLIFIGGLLALMYQPPARFARGMARVPEPLLSVVPFRRLWTFARAGHLRIGDEAPDFRLATIDRKSQVQLSSFRGQKPVVLVFGSYT